jgi:hypothetical protein
MLRAAVQPRFCSAVSVHHFCSNTQPKSHVIIKVLSDPLLVVDSILMGFSVFPTIPSAHFIRYFIAESNRFSVRYHHLQGGPLEFF